MDTPISSSKTVHVLLVIIGVMLIVFLGVATAVKLHDANYDYSHADYPSKTISVSGDGQTKAMPDVAYINFSVTGFGADKLAAQQDAAKKLADFTAFLAD